jgi:TonB family protein
MSPLTTASIPTSLPLAKSPVVARKVTYPIIAMRADNQTDSIRSLAQVLTLVLWGGCVLVGTLGFVLPYARPHAPTPTHEPVLVEKLMVELTNESPPQTAQPLSPLAEPPPPAALAQTQISTPVAVAEPSAVVFALPVEGPTITVAAAQAAHSSPAAVATSRTAGLPTPQALVFGQGEGRQPAPEYPARSAKLGQEGVVGIRLTVDANGRVIDTIVANACAWPLLNDAAERTVRHRWRFSRGALRVYEVAIHFALAK